VGTLVANHLAIVVYYWKAGLSGVKNVASHPTTVPTLQIFVPYIYQSQLSMRVFTNGGLTTE
jgi:ABC-type proline/glycine betaine transport system permease subunit